MNDKSNNQLTFTQNEMVIVCSQKPALYALRNRSGYICGNLYEYVRSDGTLGMKYAVQFEGEECSWCLEDEDLESTGNFYIENIPDNNPYKNQRFDYMEVVIIHSLKTNLVKWNGRRGFIVSKLVPQDYRPGDSREITYGVKIEGVIHTYSIAECDLESMGLYFTDEIAEDWNFGNHCPESLSSE
jgi:hypothetical protein